MVLHCYFSQSVEWRVQTCGSLQQRYEDLLAVLLDAYALRVFFSFCFCLGELKQTFSLMHREVPLLEAGSGIPLAGDGVVPIY